jgi:hypothetical protein
MIDVLVSDVSVASIYHPVPDYPEELTSVGLVMYRVMLDCPTR